MIKRIHDFFHHLDISALLTITGVILLFSTSIAITLILPQFVDPSWTQPSSDYQKQMYEMSDPNLYISSVSKHTNALQTVYHMKKNFTLSAYQETKTLRIVAPKDLEKYITALEDKKLILTSKLLLLRLPQISDSFNAVEEAEKVKNSVKIEPKPDSSENNFQNIAVLELFEAKSEEAIALRSNDSILENWVDNNYEILDKNTSEEYHNSKGVVYILNPIEYRLKKVRFGTNENWQYDPKGTPITSLEELKKHELDFRSRKELIELGEHIYAIEGCWYCHTDQTRTLIQDVVLNGSDSYPAPPSAANEYIYQTITFPGTRRIGPDLSRTGVKRPNRDWHRGHFWSPKTASAGSIMPAFQHFFDADPRGSGKGTMGIPNYKFEAIYQYLMTKGTRITSPNQAWWIGKDPVNTKAIIEGKRGVPNAPK